MTPARRCPPFVALLRRELWEHKGALVGVPVGLAFGLLALTLAAMAVGGQAWSQAGEGARAAALSADWQGLGKALGWAWSALAWALWMAAGVVTWVFGLSCLHDERTDGSSLFWRSLPVSDTHAVLAKALTALLVIPGVALAAAAGAAVLLTLAATAALSAAALPGWSALATAGFWGHLGGLAAAVPSQLLWALPAVGWVLCVSAWAPGKPFLWGLGLPVGLGLTSWMVLPSAAASWVLERVVWRVLAGAFPRPAVVQASEPLALWLDPALWVGAAVGVGLLALAAVGRRRMA